MPALADKIQLVPLFARSGLPMRQEPHKIKHFAFLGRLHPLKGIRYLIEALPANARLDIAGKDEGEERLLRNLARELGKNVHFHGVVLGDAKQRFLERCECLVLPTLSENYALVVAEALQQGKIVVTTDGASAWANVPNVHYISGFLAASHSERVELLRRELEALAK